MGRIRPGIICIVVKRIFPIFGLAVLLLAALAAFILALPVQAQAAMLMT